MTKCIRILIEFSINLETSLEELLES